MKKRVVLPLALCAFIWIPLVYQVGDTVADFKLKNVNGSLVSLSDYTSQKGLIIIFDCNTCPYSNRYNDRILALDKKCAPQGFPVIAINSNSPEVSEGDSFEEMVRQANEKNYTFPYLFDETQEVAKKFEATNTPHVFVLKRTSTEWKVVYMGAIDDYARDASGVTKHYVEDAVKAVLDGKAPAIAKTKAIGCAIKWKQ